jgi:hypothetical protein
MIYAPMKPVVAREMLANEPEGLCSEIFKRPVGRVGPLQTCVVQCRFHAVDWNRKKSGDKSMGRPRSFCTTQALNSAMQVFWRKGYEGASIAELKKAIGINSPSLYAAFGSKKELFHRVLAHYDAQNKAFMDEILAASRAQDVASLLLRGVAALVTDTETILLAAYSCKAG